MKTAKMAVLLALVFMLLAAVPVSAAPPVVEYWVYDDDSVLADSPCDFPVWDHEVCDARTTSFYDNEGNLVRFTWFFKGTNVFYNPANPGVVLVGQSAATFHFDVAEGTVFESGGTKTTLPGYGTVMMYVGHGWDFTSGPRVGNWTFDNPKDQEQFCAYMAGTLPLPPKK